MNPHSLHQLAAERHRAHYRGRPAVVPASPTPARWRRAVGLLLVEAGLHLVTTADPTRRPARLAP
jgi:hypothetical protein